MGFVLADAGLVAVAGLLSAAAGALGATALARRRFRQTAIKQDLGFAAEIESLHDHHWELQEAAAALSRAEAANEAKSRFLATVTHEIRTPLNGILGMAGLLAGTELNAEQGTYVEAIRTSGTALASLIDEILDWSRIEAGRLELLEEPADVAALAEGVVELLAPRAHGKGLEVSSFIAADVPALVRTDGARLRQVLINLVGNALKFTDRGGVGLRVWRGAEGALRFAVSDTGPGVPEARRDSIFEEFEQGDSSATRRTGGSGLGLAISRRIVERMGGQLGLDYSGPKGSRFAFSVPLHPVESSPPPTRSTRLAGRRMLIAATTTFEAEYLAERLTGAGAQRASVLGPDQALAALASEPIDVLVVDCALGEDVARTLTAAARAAGVGRRLVMFSPFERRAFGESTLDAFDGWLVKPVRNRTLVDTILGEAVERAALPRGKAPPLPPIADREILLAEDNDINALVVTRHLERLGARVTRAVDGRAAVDLAIRGLDGAQPRFTLILMDVRMPELDGCAAVREIRQAEAVRHAPRSRIVALTANSSLEDRQACLAAGMDALMVKPLDLAELARLLAGPALQTAG